MANIVIHGDLGVPSFEGIIRKRLLLWKFDVLHMNNNRLCKIVFEWSKCCASVWYKHIQAIEVKVNPYFKMLERAEWIDAWKVFEEKCWADDLAEKVKSKGEDSKLLMYSQFKKKLKFENYLELDDQKEMRSILTEIRGSACTLIEKERCSRSVPSQGLELKELKNRICPHCNENKVEDESHFLSICTAWSNERKWLEANYKEFLACVEMAASAAEAKKAKSLRAVVAKDSLAIAMLGGGAIDCLKEIDPPKWMKWQRHVRIFLLRTIAKKRAFQRKKAKSSQ